MTVIDSGVGGLSPSGKVPSSQPVPDRDRLVELLNTKGDGSRVLIQTLTAIRNGHYPKAAHTPEVAVAIQSHARHDNSTVRALVVEARKRIILNGPPGANLWFSDSAVVREMASAEWGADTVVSRPNPTLLTVPRVFSLNLAEGPLLERLRLDRPDAITHVSDILREIARDGLHTRGAHTIPGVRRLAELATDHTHATGFSVLAKRALVRIDREGPPNLLRRAGLGLIDLR
jgi:hypothetical protein